MRYYYKVYMKKIMEKNNEQIPRGTQKLGKVLKEKEAPPMKLKKLKIRSRLLKKENLTS